MTDTYCGSCESDLDCLNCHACFDCGDDCTCAVEDEPVE